MIVHDSIRDKQNSVWRFLWLHEISAFVALSRAKVQVVLAPNREGGYVTSDALVVAWNSNMVIIGSDCRVTRAKAQLKLIV